eukprot:TRINITY_DN1823_c0_g1_i1.p1 TRINITY_DN1823_c0_g1~~TRINITY_DN1823_c0_g1_i1.p1  ORF type:complete len:343 (-),score=45.28 TRINITY_DN1823_c0_g1_i1:104-1108(-)
MCQMLEDLHLGIEAEKCIKIIADSSRNLLSMFSSILDFTKIESHKLTIENTIFDLRRSINDINSIFASKIKPSVSLKIKEFAENFPKYVIGDYIRLRQVLVNLIDNAIKFTEKGEIVVSASVLSHNKAIDWCDDSSPCSHAPVYSEILLQVKDTGIGIPQNRIDQLFRPFVQVDSSFTRKYDGAGLGLAISKKLCSLMGGRIWVNSTEGSGSTFSFTIMVRIVCSNEKHHLRLTQLLQEEKGSIGDSTNVSSKLFQSEAPPVVLSQSDDLPKPMIFDRRQYNLKILLAEDNFVNQTVAVALLKREGYQNVDIVANGQQAIDALDKKHYDIVLMV